MKELKALIDGITSQLEADFAIETRAFAGQDAYYAMISKRPFFHFSGSALAGSRFLGRCAVERSALLECTVNGDGLKSEEDVFRYRGAAIPLYKDETIRIGKSCLVKTSIEGHSKDPQRPEEYRISETVSLHAHIQSSPVQRSLLGPFSTVRDTVLYRCVLGPFAYVQAGSLRRSTIGAGEMLIRGDDFEFTYRMLEETLRRYIRMNGAAPEGTLVEMAERGEARIANVETGRDVTVGLDSLLRGTQDAPVSIGEGCLILPHTIVDSSERGKRKLEIPPGRLVWGHITGAEDLAGNSLPLEAFWGDDLSIELGAMRFQGSGKSFLAEMRGDGSSPDRPSPFGSTSCSELSAVSFCVIQPYPEGDLEGFAPTISLSEEPTERD